MTHIVFVAMLLTSTAAQQPPLQHGQHHADDRARHGMGFDQQTTTHHFLLKPDGGVIEVTAKPEAAAATVDQIRTHLQHIAGAFAKGDFALPMFIHSTEPPGVATMKARNATMTFSYDIRPRGGRVLIHTKDAEALAAVHEFLRFQIREHRTGDPLDPK